MSLLENSLSLIGSSPAEARSDEASSANSAVLVRFPLCASARWPVAVRRKVGWALAQVLEPVVE